VNKPSITFQVEEKLDFSIPKREEVKKWLIKIAKSEKRKCGRLSYFFCTDKYLHALNKQFLGHDTYTDIITFDYSNGDEISGEIFISIDRVKENSKKYEQAFNNELMRIMIHGVLHLCGYGDKTPEQKKKTRQKENKSLELL
jgi:probable rRNA maturation factor